MSDEQDGVGLAGWFLFTVLLCVLVGIGVGSCPLEDTKKACAGFFAADHSAHDSLRTAHTSGCRP